MEVEDLSLSEPKDRKREKGEKAKWRRERIENWKEAESRRNERITTFLYSGDSLLASDLSKVGDVLACVRM